MKTYSLKKTIRNNPILWLLIFGIWLFYLWIIYETPYEIDDWSWGLPEGWQALLTGEWNGRYLSNLLEVTVSRSLLLKTLLIGTFAALLPVLSAQLCMRFLDDEKAYGVEAKHREKATPLFLLAVMLYLTLPIPVWAQTYGWIAGFSNFGFAGIILLIYQVILLRVLQSDRQNSKLLYAVVFLFGIGMQLVLENTTIYALAVTAFFLLEEAIKKRKENVRLFVWMLVGNMIGTVMMFKGSIYGTLMETGLAVNGMRAITIDQSKSLVENLLLCQQRFVYFFPQSIWSRNWVLSTSISILLAVNYLRKRSTFRTAAAAIFILFAALFCFMHLVGPIEAFVPDWSDVLTQRLNLLYFWFVAGSVVFLWRKEKWRMATLLFLWLSAPGLILPLTVTNMNAEAARCFLPSAVFQIEFCLILFLESKLLKKNQICNTATILLGAAVFLCCVQRLVIYHDINSVRLERAEMVRMAQKGGADQLDFPDFPHWEYLWVTEPVGERQRAYFRAFYQVPDGVKMHFNTGEENE